MFFLAGAAASSALDLVSSLQQALGGGNSSAQSSNPFDPTASAGASAGAQASATASASPPANPLSSSTLNALFSVQAQGQGGAQQPLLMVNGNALSQQMFSLLDGNGDGAISQSEFDTAFGQNGNTTQANSLFSQLDTNSDGSVNLQELTNALGGGDDAQGQGQAGQAQGVQGHHHHHHHGGGGFDLASLLGGASGSDDSGNGSGADGGAGAGDSMGIGANAGLGADLTGDATQSVTNSDGSTTTTVTYADGSKVTMTIPGATSSGQSGLGQNGSGQNSSGAPSAAMLNNFVEQMIQRQAQLLASTSVGQSLAVSA